MSRNRIWVDVLVGVLWCLLGAYWLMPGGIELFAGDLAPLNRPFWLAVGTAGITYGLLILRRAALRLPDRRRR